MIAPEHRSHDEGELAAQALLERMITRAFWQVMRQQPMPVMAALEAAAKTIGTLYRDIAVAHATPEACGCGFRPDAQADLMVLEAMLSAAARPVPTVDLATLPAAGRA